MKVCEDILRVLIVDGCLDESVSLMDLLKKIYGFVVGDFVKFVIDVYEMVEE